MVLNQRPSEQLDEERIFHTARLLPTPEARSDYLDQVCSGDQALRERVESLLEIEHQEQSFLKSADRALPATIDTSSATERPGTMIGRFKLMEQIGEGGMGVVFVAQQEKPIRRKVALKVIKPGMDSKSVVARFEAERQALAMMDHPNIAKVLDAGTTESGRPYFAMELVKGLPITEYCNKHRLTVRERLDLFTVVCRAIQHAHQKGIIHRDIKPSNVLVSLHDGQPVPKVIDFGIAKALNARLTDKTIYTEHLQIVGTLLYMSPEQADFGALDVDTQSDVYSLGVLLYELLTGTTPFEKVELEKAGFDEQRRIIREQDPPRASLRLSSLGEAATTVAEQRHTDPKKLNQILRGDLDWIVLKALEKDRVRRYATADAFAADIDRYLLFEPVLARSPSVWYRTRKYCRRNSAILSLTAALALGLWLTSWQAIRAERAAKQANLEATRADSVLTDLVAEILDRAWTLAFVGDLDEMEEALDRARRAGAEEDVQNAIRGIGHIYGGRRQEATLLLDSVVARSPDSLVAHAAATFAHLSIGDYERAGSLYEKTYSLYKRSGNDIDDYSKLLLIQSRTYGEISLDDVEEISSVIDNHPRWGVPYAVRALLRKELAQRSLETELMDKAFGDCELAGKFSPDSVFVLNARMQTCCYGLELRRHLGLETQAIEEMGRRLCDEIQPLAHDLRLRASRATFYKLTHQNREFASERAAVLASGYCAPQPKLAEMVRLDDPGLADFTSDANPTMPRVANAIRLALNGNREAALRIHSELQTTSLTTNSRMFAASDILSIIGDSESLTDTAQQILDRIDDSEAPTMWWFNTVTVKFLAGKIGKESFLQQAGPFNYERTAACYFIGMKMLAEGNHAEAHDWLREASESAATGWWNTEFSHVYLERLFGDSAPGPNSMDEQGQQAPTKTN